MNYPTTPQFGLIQKLSLTLLACTLSLTTSPILTLAQLYIPPDRGLPGRREGGGTRGSCVTSQPSLTALIPKNNFGLTTQANPTLFWYLPPTTAKMAEFELRNEADEILYTRQVEIPEEIGIIQIHLPQTEKTTLEVGKLYHWYFNIICDAEDRSGDVVTEGWIERQTPNQALTNRITQASGEERAKLYAKEGYWYDALGTLADLRSVQSDQPAPQTWVDLLTEVNLQFLTDKPLIPSCMHHQSASS